LFCFVLFCFVLFCFVLFCFVLFCFVSFISFQNTAALQSIRFTLQTTETELAESQRRNDVLQERYSFLNYRSRILRSCLPPLTSLIDCDSKLEILLGRDDLTNCYRSTPQIRRPPPPLKMQINPSNTPPHPKDIHPHHQPQQQPRHHHQQPPTQSQSAITSQKNTTENRTNPHRPSLVHPTAHTTHTTHTTHTMPMTTHTTPTHTPVPRVLSEEAPPHTVSAWVNFFPLFNRSKKTANRASLVSV
jgi:hypothetical protein